MSSKQNVWVNDRGDRRGSTTVVDGRLARRGSSLNVNEAKVAAVNAGSVKLTPKTRRVSASGDHSSFQ